MCTQFIVYAKGEVYGVRRSGPYLDVGGTSDIIGGGPPRPLLNQGKIEKLRSMTGTDVTGKNRVLTPTVVLGCKGESVNSASRNLDEVPASGTPHSKVEEVQGSFIHNGRPRFKGPTRASSFPDPHGRLSVQYKSPPLSRQPRPDGNLVDLVHSQ